MIRNAIINDIDFIMNLEKGNIIHPWVMEDIKALVTVDNKVALVCEKDGNVVGYVGYSFVLDEAEIGNLVVDKDYRRQGIAMEIMSVAIENMRSIGIAQIFLEVEDTNESAINLYRKIGFEKYGSRKDYYGPSIGADLMKIVL